MSDAEIRECALGLAREFHATSERKRCPAHQMERCSWAEMPEATRALLTETFYSLVFRGIVICPVPAHRIGIDLRKREEPA